MKKLPDQTSLYRFESDDFYWAVCSCLLVLAILLVVYDRGVNALVLFSTNQVAPPVASGDAPSFRCSFDTAIATNTLDAMESDANHQACTTL